MTTLSEKAQAFLAANPTKIITVDGITYYEHPEFGDEAPLFFINHEGKLKRSEFWDAECAMEAGTVGTGWN